jgi:hypothetical protein
LLKDSSISVKLLVMVSSTSMKCFSRRRSPSVKRDSSFRTDLTKSSSIRRSDSVRRVLVFVDYSLKRRCISSRSIFDSKGMAPRARAKQVKWGCLGGGVGGGGGHLSRVGAAKMDQSRAGNYRNPNRRNQLISTTLGLCDRSRIGAERCRTEEGWRRNRGYLIPDVSSSSRN